MVVIVVVFVFAADAATCHPKSVCCACLVKEILMGGGYFYRFSEAKVLCIVGSYGTLLGRSLFLRKRRKGRTADFVMPDKAMDFGLDENPMRLTKETSVAEYGIVELFGRFGEEEWKSLIATNFGG